MCAYVCAYIYLGLNFETQNRVRLYKICVNIYIKLTQKSLHKYKSLRVLSFLTITAQFVMVVEQSAMSSVVLIRTIEFGENIMQNKHLLDEIEYYSDETLKEVDLNETDELYDSSNDAGNELDFDVNDFVANMENIDNGIIEDNFNFMEV